MAEAVFGGVGYDYLRSPPSIPTCGLAEYNIRETELERAYARLSVVDAIQARGAFRMIPVLFSCGWLIYLIFKFGSGVLLELAGLVLRTAHAESATSSYIPPLGLSQGIFDIVVLVFVCVMVIVIVGLLYAGFLAKSKSAKAAALVEHFGSFLLGAFFGTKIPS